MWADLTYGPGFSCLTGTVDTPSYTPPGQTPVDFYGSPATSNAVGRVGYQAPFQLATGYPGAGRKRLVSSIQIPVVPFTYAVYEGLFPQPAQTYAALPQISFKLYTRLYHGPELLGEYVSEYDLTNKTQVKSGTFPVYNVYVINYATDTVYFSGNVPDSGEGFSLQCDIDPQSAIPVALGVAVGAGYGPYINGFSTLEYLPKPSRANYQLVRG